MIRTATPADVAPVVALWERTPDVLPTVTDGHDHVERLLARDADALLVAEAGGEIVGTLIAAWDGWRGGFYRLAVDVGHRRNGIALALVRAGEARLSRLGAQRVAALVAVDEAHAVGFWTAAGYVRPGHDARFVKDLAQAAAT